MIFITKACEGRILRRLFSYLVSDVATFVYETADFHNIIDDDVKYNIVIYINSIVGMLAVAYRLNRLERE